MTIFKMFERPIAFHRCLVGPTGSITAALMLSQCIYWTNRTKDKEGWFYKTVEEWFNETGMTKHEQETAKKNLMALGVLEVQKKGMPAKNFFRVSEEALGRLTLMNSDFNSSFQAVHQSPGIRSTGRRKSGHQSPGKRTTSEPESGSQFLINTITTSNTTTNADPTGSASKDPSLYVRAIEVFDRFCKSTMNVGAKIDGVQGKAMKSIISYLRTNSQDKSDDSIVKGLEYIFTNWDTLDPFLRGQVKLSQINSNLQNILNQLRNGSSGKGNKQQALRDLQTLKDSLGRSQSA